MLVEKIIPFFTPLWKFNIGGGFDADIAACYQVQNEVPSTEKSNVGGYQSQNVDLKTKFPDLVRRVSPSLDGVVQDSELNLGIDNAWVNINKTNNSNISHYHPQSALSGVIYLQTSPKAGRIVFENPTVSGAFPIDPAVKHFFGVYFIAPEVGDVLIFPSYLKHYVEPNLSSEDRISIAFNMV